MRNFALPTGPSRISTEMKPDSLRTGQVLIRAEFAQWGDGETRLGRYVVERVTKTRVVIRHEAHAPGQHDVRLLVRDGVVSTKREGGSEYSTFDNYFLASLDDEEVERITRRNEKRALKRKAIDAATLTAKNLTIESAQEAIQALSIWLVSTSVQDDD